MTSAKSTFGKVRELAIIPGVYLLHFRGQSYGSDAEQDYYYIGEAENIAARVTQHRREKKTKPFESQDYWKQLNRKTQVRLFVLKVVKDGRKIRQFHEERFIAAAQELKLFLLLNVPLWLHRHPMGDLSEEKTQLKAVLAAIAKGQKR